MAYDEDDDERPTPPRPAGEGVRIIGAQEAAQREAELQSGRLPDDALRYGDVPPSPEGPRPAVRFPLPDDGEPPATPHAAEAPRAPATPPAGATRGGGTVAPPASSGPAPDLPHWSEPPTGEVPKILLNDEVDE